MKNASSTILILGSLAACGGRVENVPPSPGSAESAGTGTGESPGTEIGGEEPPSTGEPGSGAKPHNANFEAGSFTAEYYASGKLVATENVERPTINYAWSDFHGIRSEDFRGVWKGTLDVTAPSSSIDFNADYSWADGKLFIDDKEIPWNRVMSQTLTAGPHSIRVELDNNWHTTGFNMSFTRNPIYDSGEALQQIKPSVTADTKIVHVDIYESSDRYNNVLVSLTGARKPVFLVLSSYASVKWEIDNPENFDIRGVAYGAYGPGPTVAVAKGTPTYEVSNLRYEQAGASSVTGRNADVVKKEYALGHATIAVP